MKFSETSLAGAFIVEPQRLPDERGFFARTYCSLEFERLSLNTIWVQFNLSFNKQRGTLRGMHYQASPHQEEKLISCIRGSVFDVIIDLRPESPTFGRHFSVVLTGEARSMIYVPKGFAHGFLTLSDETEILYHISEYYTPDAARGVRWNDPAFSIPWPDRVRVVSERDMSYADFDLKYPSTQ